MPDGKVRLVVVDDEIDACEALSAALELEGYDVRVATDADDAAATVAAHQPACVLLDLFMPGATGVTLARRLRDTYGDDLLLVMLTGFARREYETVARAAGVNHVLYKPVDIALLREFLPPAG